jgi:nicotinamidase/pyrazinamidase
VNGEDGYSGFAARDPLTQETVPTELPGLLEDAGVTKIVVAGLATDYCVRSTVLDALERGLATTLLADAIRAVDLGSGDGDRALAEVQAAGATIVRN